MNINKILSNVAIILGIMLGSFYLYKKDIHFNMSGPYDVKSIEVLSGYEFDISSDIGKIHGRLNNVAVSEAKNAVVKFLNDVRSPKFFILNKSNDFYIIKIVVIKGDKEVDLEEWLKSNGLLNYGFSSTKKML
jgi:hypothetical protein